MSAKSKRKKKKQYIKEQFEALSKTFYEKPGVGVAKVKEIRKSHAKQIFRSKQADWIAQDVKELIQTLSDTCSYNKLQSLQSLYEWYVKNHAKENPKFHQIVHVFMKLRENVIETHKTRKFKTLEQLVVQEAEEEEVEVIDYVYERTEEELEWRKDVEMEEEDSLSDWSDDGDVSGARPMSGDNSGKQRDMDCQDRKQLPMLSAQDVSKIRLIANDLRHQGRIQQISEWATALLGLPISSKTHLPPQVLSYSKKFTVLDSFLYTHRTHDSGQVSVRNFIHGIEKWLLAYQTKIRSFRHENISDLSDLRLLFHLQQDFQFLDFIIDVLIEPFLDLKEIQTHQLLTHLDNLLISETFSACSPESDFLIRVFIDSLTPYLQSFDAWMTSGRILSDCEFFIKNENPHLQEHSDFSFHWARIPSFFRALAPQILSTGKCIHVIRSIEIKNHVHPSQSFFSKPKVTSATEVREKIEAYLDCDIERQLGSKYRAGFHSGVFGSYAIDNSFQERSLDFGFDILEFESPLNLNRESPPPPNPSFAFVPLEQLLHQTLQTIVKNRYSETNASLYEIVNITPHLISVRSFFCMEAGDVAITFSSSLFQLLREQDMTSILPDLVQEKLLSSLESSTQASLFESHCFRFTLEDTNKKLTPITVLESFKFDYEVSWPLSELISERVKQYYNEIFVFLLQCRRAHFELTSCARGHRKNDTLDVIHKFYIIRHHIFHLLTRLWDHVTRQVRFADWDVLESLLKEGASLAKLESTHADLLTSIQNKLFLRGPWARARVFIMSMLSLACDLSRLWERKITLFHREHDALNRMGAWSQMQKFPKERSEWTQTMTRLHQRVQKFEKLRLNCLECLKTIEQNFQRQHRICLTMLKQVLGKTFRPEVEFLLLTLNFNQFHTRQNQQKSRLQRPSFNFKF